MRCRSVLLSGLRLRTPHLQTGRPHRVSGEVRTSPRHSAYRERFGCVLGMLSSLEVKVLRPT
jgi:hypothetical protein